MAVAGSGNASCDLAPLESFLLNLKNERPSALEKGVPNGFSGRYTDLAAQDYRLGDERLPMPVAFLRESAVAHNRKWMAQYLHASGVQLAPHGKTSLSPELFAMQIEDGVWGLTAANAQQLSFFAQMGIRRVIVANQIVGSGNINIVLDCASRYLDLEFYLLVDSRANVDILSDALAKRSDGVKLRLLIEIGFAGGRTGLRDMEEALALARHIHKHPALLLAGVEGYEGIVAGADQAAREAAVVAMIKTMRDFAAKCDALALWDIDHVLLTAGGTEFFDLCSEGLSKFQGAGSHRVVIRSGCYVTSDSIGYKRAFERICERSSDAAAVEMTPPEGALQVWAAIQSRPEKKLAFATLGKRDISHDWDLPVPLLWLRPGEMQLPQAIPEGHRVLRLNDQHTYLEIPEDSPLQVGDLIGFGISHACTTFDKWRLIYRVDDQYRVTGAIRTFF